MLAKAPAVAGDWAGLFPTVTIRVKLKFRLTTKHGWKKMALSDQGARNIAAKIIEAIGQSDQMKTIGPNTTSGATVEHQVKRGELDAAYLSSLYLNLVKRLKE